MSFYIPYKKQIIGTPVRVFNKDAPSYNTIYFNEIPIYTNNEIIEYTFNEVGEYLVYDGNEETTITIVSETPEEIAENVLTNDYINLTLPYESIKIGTNDFGTSTIINNLLTKAYENLSFIVGQTEIVDVTQRNEFSKSLQVTVNGYDWISSEVSTGSGSDLIDIKVTKDFIYLLGKNYLNAFDYNKDDNAELKFSIGGAYNYAFEDLKAFSLKDDGDFYILDGNKVYHIISTLSGEFRLINFANSTSFGTLTDILYEPINKKVYVTDSKNKKIFQFSSNLVYEKEIILQEGFGPLKFCCDKTSIYVVTDTLELLTYALDFSELLSESSLIGLYNYYELKNYVESREFQKLAIDSNSYYLYLTLEDIIVKIGKNGKLINWVHKSNNANLKSCYIDQNGNLYVVGSEIVLKYFDELSLSYLRRIIARDLQDDVYLIDNVGNYLTAVPDAIIWSYYGLDVDDDLVDIFLTDDLGNILISSILSENVTQYTIDVSSDILTYDVENVLMYNNDGVSIKTDEFVQDWVYSKSIIKLLKNIELFALTIKYKLYQNFIDGNLTGFYLDEVPSYSNYSKDYDLNCFIGKNEFVSVPVLNRIFEKVLEKQQELWEMIKVENSYVYSLENLYLPTTFTESEAYIIAPAQPIPPIIEVIDEDSVLITL